MNGSRYISLYTWANVLRPGGYNVVHTHGRGSNPGEWSGAVYIDVGGKSSTQDNNSNDTQDNNSNDDNSGFSTTHGGAFEILDPRG